MARNPTRSSQARDVMTLVSKSGTQRQKSANGRVIGEARVGVSWKVRGRTAVVLVPLPASVEDVARRLVGKGPRIDWTERRRPRCRSAEAGASDSQAVTSAGRRVDAAMQRASTPSGTARYFGRHADHRPKCA